MPGPFLSHPAHAQPARPGRIRLKLALLLTVAMVALPPALVSSPAMAQSDTSASGATASGATASGSGTGTTAGAGCSTAVAQALSTATVTKVDQAAAVAQKMYQKPPSVTALSCLSNLLNLGGNLFFNLPSLGSLLSNLLNSLCTAATNEFNSLTQPILSQIQSAAGSSGNLTLPGGIYLGTVSTGASIGQGTSSASSINWSGGNGPAGNLTVPGGGINPLLGSNGKSGTPTSSSYGNY